MDDKVCYRCRTKNDFEDICDRYFFINACKKNIINLWDMYGDTFCVIIIELPEGGYEFGYSDAKMFWKNGYTVVDWEINKLVVELL